MLSQSLGNTTLSIASEKHTGFAYQYVYDKSGNIVGILNGVKGSNGNYTFPTVTFSSDYNQTFAYDRYNQLTTHTDNNSGTVTGYSYDNDGKITQRTVTVNGTTTTYTYTYADTLGWGDLLTKYNGQTITYDAIGNPLTYRDSMTMTWASGRELMTLSKGNTNLSFTYDPNGLRTKKTITTSSGTANVEYIYEGGLLRQMKHGAKYFDFFYDANGTAAGFAYRQNASSAPTYYYYGVNTRGDVEVIYNSTGLVLAKYKYDAYGKLLNVTNSATTDYYCPDVLRIALVWNCNSNINGLHTTSASYTHELAKMKLTIASPDGTSIWTSYAERGNVQDVTIDVSDGPYGTFNVAIERMDQGVTDIEYSIAVSRCSYIY